MLLRSPLSYAFCIRPKQRAHELPWPRIPMVCGVQVMLAGSREAGRVSEAEAGPRSNKELSCMTAEKNRWLSPRGLLLYALGFYGHLKSKRCELHVHQVAWAEPHADGQTFHEAGTVVPVSGAFW